MEEFDFGFTAVDESELDALLPVLAHHWTRTRNCEKASMYLQAATEKAIAMYQNREAIANIGLLLEPVSSPVLARIQLSTSQVRQL